MMSLKKRISLALAIFIGMASFAQTRDSAIIPDRDINYEKGKFKPVLEKSDKVIVPPTQEKVEIKTPTFEYDIAKYQANTKRVATPLAPLSYKNNEKEDWRGNYVKLGYGNFNMPLAEAYLFNLKDDELIYGAELKHLSANPGSTFQDFSENKIKLYGARILKNNQFTVNLGYDRTSLRRYGFDSTEAGFTKNDLLRNFEDWNGSFRFNRVRNKKNTPQFGFLLDYHSFATSDRANESSIEGVLDFKMRAFEGQIFTDLSLMHTKATTPNLLQERIFLEIFPRYEFKHPKEDLDITAGFKANYIPSGVDSNLLIFPHLEGRYHLIKDYVVVFAGFTGGLDKTLLRSQVNNNPFITDTFVLRSQINTYRASLGFEGKLTKNLEFLGEFSVGQSQNIPLYVTNTDTFSSFKVIYGDAEIISFKTQLGYTFSTKIRAFLLARINDYAFSSDGPWQLPTSEVRFRFQYNVAEKLQASTEVIYWGARQQLEIGKPVGNMDGFVDFNLKFDYRYKKHVSFFADFNNITSSRIQRWYNYPVYNLNILAGVNFSF